MTIFACCATGVFLYWTYFALQGDAQNLWQSSFLETGAPFALGVAVWALAGWKEFPSIRRVALSVTMNAAGAVEIALIAGAPLIFLFGEPSFAGWLLAGLLPLEVMRQTLKTRADADPSLRQRTGMPFLLLAAYGLNYYAAVGGDLIKGTPAWNPWLVFWLLVWGATLTPALLQDRRRETFAVTEC